MGIFDGIKKGIQKQKKDSGSVGGASQSLPQTVKDNSFKDIKQEWQRLQKELKKNPHSKTALYELSLLYIRTTTAVISPKESQLRSNLSKAIEKKYGLSWDKAHFNVEKETIRVLQETLKWNLQRTKGRYKHNLNNAFLRDTLRRTIDGLEEHIDSDDKNCPWKRLQQESEDQANRYLGNIENSISKLHQEFLSLANLIREATGNPSIHQYLIQDFYKCREEINNKINKLIEDHAKNAHSLLNKELEKYKSSIDTLCDQYEQVLCKKYPNLEAAAVKDVVSHLKDSFVKSEGGESTVRKWNFYGYTSIDRWRDGIVNHETLDREGENSYLWHLVQDEVDDLGIREEEIDDYFSSLFDSQKPAEEGSAAVKSLLSQNQDFAKEIQELGKSLLTALEDYRLNIESTAEILRQQHPNDFAWYHITQDIETRQLPRYIEQGYVEPGSVPGPIVEEAKQLFQAHLVAENLQAQYRVLERLAVTDPKNAIWHKEMHLMGQELQDLIEKNAASQYDLSQQRKALEKLQSAIDKTCNQSYPATPVQKPEKSHSLSPASDKAKIRQVSAIFPQIKSGMHKVFWEKPAAILKGTLQSLNQSVSGYSLGQATQEWQTLQEKFKDNIAAVREVALKEKSQEPHTIKAPEFTSHGTTRYKAEPMSYDDAMKELQNQLKVNNLFPFFLRSTNGGAFHARGKGFVEYEESCSYDTPEKRCNPGQNPWKIHISIAKFEDIIAAFKALSPIFIEKYDVAFKITGEESFKKWNSPEKPSQNGKVFTVYPRDVASMKKMIPEIEQALKKVQIEPGLSPESDLRAGDYCYVRDSYDIYGEYVWGKDAVRQKERGEWHKTYVCEGKDDPFAEGVTNEPSLSDMSRVLQDLAKCKAFIQQNIKPRSPKKRTFLEEVNETWQQNLTLVTELADTTPDAVVKHRILRDLAPYKSDIEKIGPDTRQALFTPEQGQKRLEQLIHQGVRGVELEEALAQIARDKGLGTDVSTKLQTTVSKLQQQGKSADNILEAIKNDIKKAADAQTSSQTHLGGLAPEQTTRTFSVHTPEAGAIAGNGDNDTNAGFQTFESRPFDPTQDPIRVDERYRLNPSQTGMVVHKPGLQPNKQDIDKQGAVVVLRPGAVWSPSDPEVLYTPDQQYYEVKQPDRANDIAASPAEFTPNVPDNETQKPFYQHDYVQKAVVSCTVFADAMVRNSGIYQALHNPETAKMARNIQHKGIHKATFDLAKEMHQQSSASASSSNTAKNVRGNQEVKSRLSNPSMEAKFRKLKQGLQNTTSQSFKKTNLQDASRRAASPAVSKTGIYRGSGSSPYRGPIYPGWNALGSK